MCYGDLIIVLCVYKSGSEEVEYLCDLFVFFELIIFYVFRMMWFLKIYC